MPGFPRIDRLGSNPLRVCLVCSIVLMLLVWGGVLESKEVQESKQDDGGDSVEDVELGENNSVRNISGYYEGRWNVTGTLGSLKRSLFLRGKQGRLLIDLTSSPMKESGLSIVKGDIVLREADDSHMSDNDFRMKLEGVYVQEVGRVKAQLKPSYPFVVPISEQDIQERGPLYRKALRHESIRWSRNHHQFRQFGLPIDQQIHLMKECHFVMDLHINLVDSDSEGVPHGLFDAGARRLLVENEELPLKVLGEISSQDCPMTMSVNATSFKLEKFYAKAVHYTVGSTVVTFIQILLLIDQVRTSSTPGTAMRVSMMSVSQQATIDAYLCLVHLTAGIVREPLFNTFAMLSFFEFVLFAIFEMRYMLLVWRAQRGQSLDPWDTRRELSILYTRFYAVLLGGIIFSYRLYKHMRVIVLVFYSFWLPQVWHCIRSDVRQPLKPLFVVGMTVTRLLLPLYVYGCPKNLLGVTPDPTLCISLSGFMLFQMVLLQLQYSFGPHCFVPRRYLPDKYDYFRALEPEEVTELIGDANGDEETGHAGQMECVICMGTVDIRRARSRMVTPCSHFFHPQCLQRWMDVKMECPTCRANLPAL